MKHLFPALCWAVPVGGLLLACSRHPKPVTAPPAPKGEIYQEEPPRYDSDEKALVFGGARPPASPIYFDFDSYALKEADKAAALAYFLSVRPGMVVDLRGHASAEGTDDYNLHLGARRASAVRAYLEAAGISEHRITWTSYGEEQLAETPEKSRRVEFHLEDSK